MTRLSLVRVFRTGGTTTAPSPCPEGYGDCLNCSTVGCCAVVRCANGLLYSQHKQTFTFLPHARFRVRTRPSPNNRALERRGSDYTASQCVNRPCIPLGCTADIRWKHTKNSAFECVVFRVVRWSARLVGLGLLPEVFVTKPESPEE